MQRLLYSTREQRALFPGSRRNYRPIDRNDSMRCRWEFNRRVIFSALSLYYNERFHSTATTRNSCVLLCTRNLCVCSISPHLFLISTLISEKLPSRDFCAESARLLCKSFEITRSQNLIENSVWTSARMHAWKLLSEILKRKKASSQ